MTQRQRMAYIAYVTAAYSMSVLLLGAASIGGGVFEARPATILWWRLREVLGWPAIGFLVFGIHWMTANIEVRRDPRSLIALVLLVLAVSGCFLF